MAQTQNITPNSMGRKNVSSNPGNHNSKENCSVQMQVYVPDGCFNLNHKKTRGHKGFHT